MSYSFSQADQAYRSDHINDLARDAGGRRYLLLKSLSRAEHTERLSAMHHIDLASTPRRQQLEVLFESDISETAIKETISIIHHEQRQHRLAIEEELVSQLYLMESFDWGGLHQNSLEKTIVDNYVKRIVQYDRLNECIDNELLASMRGYVRCSWYNHWTSILIEDIFKDHPRVIPAVGQIKKVDFFVDEVPFDLKVTYLPEGFIREWRSWQGDRPEITVLKRVARECSVAFDNDLPESRLLQFLVSRLADHPQIAAKQAVQTVLAKRREALQECTEDPALLIRWLYENQGVRRFDASNRLFLVLVNEGNYFDSWKLKRAKELLSGAIGSYLDNLDPSDIGREVDFQWEGRTYSSTSDALFVIHGA